jgi:hypothetical protein
MHSEASLVILKAGLGVIICNDQGAPIASLSKKIDLPFMVEEVEAREAATLVQHLGISRVVFEGDCSSVISAYTVTIHVLQPMVILLKILGLLPRCWTGVLSNTLNG